MASLFSLEEAYRAGREDMATSCRRADYAVRNQIVRDVEREEVVATQSILLQLARIKSGQLPPMREILMERD